MAETEAKPLRVTALHGPQSQIDAASIADARQILIDSKCPIVYAGGGVRTDGGVEVLRDFIEDTDIPVVHTLHGVGGLPGNHPLFLGMIGMHGNQAANTAVQECDLLIAVGARFDDRATGNLKKFAPNAAVIHIDIDPAELGKLRKPFVSLAGNMRDVLPHLAGPELDIQPWREKCAALKQQHQWRYDAPTEKIFAPEFFKRAVAARR